MRWILLCLISALPLQLAAAAQPLTPERAVKYWRISDLRYSPDGSVAVCAASIVNGPTPEGHLWLVNPTKKELRQLTFSAKIERSPEWAPQGDRVAFLSNRSGLMQVYVMSRTGGNARAVTTSASAVTDFRWSPDGSQIAYLARKDDPERDVNAPHIADRTQDLARLWVTDVGSGDSRELTGGVLRIDEIAWVSPERILTIASEQPALETWHSALYEIAVRDGAVRLLSRPNQPFVRLQISPERKQLAFVSTGTGGPIAHDLFLQPAESGAARNMTASVDRAVLEVHWQNDNTIVARVAEGFTNRLVRIDSKGSVSRIALPYSVRAFDVARNGDIVFAGVGFNRLPEVFVRRSTGAVAQIGELQSGWEAITLADAEIFRFRSFDGTAVEAALMKPSLPSPAVAAAPTAPAAAQPPAAPLAPAAKWPLVVLVHGGPASNFTADYFWFNAWAQLLAARGYAVLFVNPRGSIGYGEKFVAANRGDLGGGDYKDILGALDTVIARGTVDAGRVGIGGWSYGGQMTEWAIGHTDRFKAAVVGQGVYDEASEYGTEDSPADDEWYFGTPWEHPDVYARNSPATFIGNARTPTLIMHGEDDTTNPVGQSKALYRALKRLGVETELITYPGEGHLPRQERHQVDVMQRMLEWFDRHLQ
jgi:dipeptidyl aminopeptidase/acylaminoacyl peptidase